MSPLSCYRLVPVAAPHCGLRCWAPGLPVADNGDGNNHLGTRSVTDLCLSCFSLNAGRRGREGMVLG